MPARLTQEQFLERCDHILPDFKPLEEYRGSASKMLWQHKCGRSFLMRPDKMFPRKTCPYCSRERVGAQFRAKNALRFPEKLSELHLEIVGDFAYKNNRQKVMVRCAVCGHKQESLVGNIFSGHGCASCGNKLATKRQGIAEYTTVAC